METISYPYDHRAPISQAIWDIWSVVKYSLKRASIVYPPQHLPPLLKHAVLQRYARKYGLRSFVETGTYKGDATARMLKYCDRLYSVEFQPFFAEKARERFASNPSVTIYQGDGAHVLPRILAEINRPTLFWLDAHFPPADADKATNCCPTVEELHAVLAHPVKGHVILIDDVKDFKGAFGYPTVEQMVGRIRSVRPDLSVTIKNDIFRIVPRSK